MLVFQKSAFTRMMIFARGSQGSRVAVLLTNTIMNHRQQLCLASPTKLIARVKIVLTIVVFTSCSKHFEVWER
ncbi:hypothetical protein T4E_7858 [Trichinella pseudospiralis]|uniref:Uncharacterized protein n=1 Tax=Trichinella pseudospiralis TaxID=6337 RepID=A0A0V0YQ01_TRIPS|nr:hypothetical protein T4E_7858 [Trichinella pseudospiralis]